MVISKEVRKMKEQKRLLCASMFVMIDRITLIQKNGGKKSFSYQAKASMSSIPTRRICLWHPIEKKKINTCMQVCHN